MSKYPDTVPFMTPLVTLVYPKLNSPDTKFKAEGEFATKANMSPEDAAAFILKYEAVVAKYFETVKAELQEKLKAAKTGAEKGKLKKELDELKPSDKPFKPVFDDDGNETGDLQFNFKLPAQVTRAKDGKVTKLYPDFADAKGKPIKFKDAPSIWGGTTAHIAGEFRPFYTAKAGVGASLRLLAVQIIELQSGSGGNRSYGFGAQEGGYEAPEGGQDDADGGSGEEEGSGAKPASSQTEF